MVMKTLTKAQFIKYLRRRRLTETFRGIAADLGVSKQAVEQWVNGDNEPSRLVLTAAAIHVQLENLKRKAVRP